MEDRSVYRGFYNSQMEEKTFHSLLRKEVMFYDLVLNSINILVSGVSY